MDVPVSILVAAALLGATHAVEPDHVTGIAALASESHPARAALVGACFALGHVALVAAWVVVGAVLLAGLPAIETFGAVGRTVLGIVLVVVGLLTARVGVRSVRERGRGREGGGHEGGGHAHPFSGLAIFCLVGAAQPTTTRGFLGLGVVGALFTLSPPLSMLAFVTGVLPAAGVGAAGLAVGVYALAITALMTLVGAGAGVAFGVLRGRGRSVHAVGQLLAGVTVSALGVVVLAGLL